AAADPLGALHGLARLDAPAAAPPPASVGPLLRLLGGSPTLAAVLAAAGPALLAEVLAVPARDPAAHVAALAAAGMTGALARAPLQAALRRHRRREFVRIGGRDLLGLATVDETV